MNRCLFQQTTSVIAVLLVMGWPSINGQYTFEIRVDSSEYLTDIPTETGRHLKFLATDERLVVLDFENSRILFYEKDTSFKNNKILRIVGQHSLVQEYRPFIPVIITG